MAHSNAYVKKWEVLCNELGTTLEKGLSYEESLRRHAVHGFNDLQVRKQTGRLTIFLHQFKSPFILILGLAALMSVFFSQFLDAAAIGVVLLINAVIGFAMEYQAKRSMEALRKLTVVPAKVIRDGRILEIPSRELVPGDILYVESGDMIQADARLANIAQLEVNESALTGESIPVAKQTGVLEQGSALADQSNMLFRGTFVTRGTGYAVVVRTGMHTELGKIASMVQDTEEQETPLERKINAFSQKLIWITTALVVLIFLSGLMNGHPFISMFKTSIALAVAAVPEALPIVATLALAHGMLMMARHQVIVKRLAAVETLGGTTVILTDKTGTLTENEIEVAAVAMEEGRMAVRPDPLGGKLSILEGEALVTSATYERVKLACCLCNTAELSVKGNELHEVGDPLETGLLKFVHAAGMDIFGTRRLYVKVREEAFTSESKMMATCHLREAQYFTFAKGAVEELLHRCTSMHNGAGVIALVPDHVSRLKEEAHQMAASGLRVIGVAWKETEEMPDALSKDLVFLGMIGMIDPPRLDVAGAIKECRDAGIKVVMATGDHPATAHNIGLQLGIVEEGGEVVTGTTFDAFMKEPIDRRHHVRIFARLTPRQKLELVRQYQSGGEVVGMTGDGVNDAPALKQSDIGIAMGKRGTQVAQEAADIVLKNDSFSAIVTAVRMGRTIFNNIRTLVMFLLSSNLSELAVIGVTGVLDTHFALVPLQILFINLVTDALPALALGVTAAPPGVMMRMPSAPGEPILRTKEWFGVVVYALVLAGAALASVYWIHEARHVSSGVDALVCNNVLFLTLIVSKLLHVYNVGPYSKSGILQSEIARNPYVWLALFACLGMTVAACNISPLSEALGLGPVSLQDWGVVAAVSMGSLLFNRLLRSLHLVGSF